ncbi:MULTISPECIES: hypothetical protein [Gordonia]|uniref:hypothetical protein n=1 Tax=Gordonia TaxID=2053 RepID=UPI001484F0FE|nr:MULTISPECIES: hypothetical protein [Gordonia]MCZ4580427.1 hypothetical protein [Gordonia amicalis]
MASRPLRIVLFVDGVLACGLVVLLAVLLTRPAGDVERPVVRTDDGVTCVLGAPYIGGGGPRAGYVFDDNCLPVAHV